MQCTMEKEEYFWSVLKCILCVSETDYLCFAADGYGGRAEAGEATGDPYN